MAGPARVVTRRRSRNAARRFVAERGFRRHADTVLYVGLMLGTAITGFSIWRWPHAVPPLAVAPFILLAGLLLRIQRLNHGCALNGLILPFGFGIVIWVALMRRDLLGGYRYPKVLAYVGLVVWLLTIYLGYESFSGIVDLWQQ